VDSASLSEAQLVLKTSAVCNLVQLKLKTYFVSSPSCASLKVELKLLSSPILGIRRGGTNIFDLVFFRLKLINIVYQADQVLFKQFYFRAVRLDFQKGFV
jgi:hypothetical protein